MIVDILKETIIENIGLLKPSSKNWQKRNCMLCHTQGHGLDKRSRFGIQFNIDSIAIHCFNCGFSASYKEGKYLSKSFKLFLREINISDEFIKKIDFEIFKYQNNIVGTEDSFEDLLRLNSLSLKWQPSTLPTKCNTLKYWLEHNNSDTCFMKVVEYAINRGLYDIDRLFWSPDTRANINKRLIIPFYYKNKVVGYTARLSYPTTDKSIPKYYQAIPQDFVYNVDAQENYQRKYVIVNEGVLDAFVTDGVAILGEMNKQKADVINRLGKIVIVCPDRDKKGGDLVKFAINNNWLVSFPRWDSSVKDAAQAVTIYGRLLTVHSILNSAIQDKLQIEVAWGISSNERN